MAIKTKLFFKTPMECVKEFYEAKKKKIANQKAA